MSEEALQIAEKRREVKGKGEKIYSSECKVPKNSKERQDALVREQCEEIEENNRMGKTRIEWERLEISSRKLEIPREHFMQRWA